MSRRALLVVSGLAAMLVAAGLRLACGPGHGAAPAADAPPVEAGAARDPTSAEIPGARDETNASDAPEVRESAAAQRGILFCTVNEVDACIDPAGTTLVLRDAATGEVRNAVIGADGFAAFADVPVEGAFELATAVPDRRMFPERIELAPDRFQQIEGDPPSASVSVSLVHVHELSGVVRDATSGAPIAGATVATDSFFASRADTGADGRFALNLPEPAGTLVVRAPGYQELSWRYPESVAAGGAWLPDRRDFELLPDRVTAWLDVEARLPDGAPAADAALEVTELQTFAIPEQALRELGPAGVDAFAGALQSELQALGRASGVGPAEEPLKFDAHGTARLQVRLPGRLRLQARHGAHVAQCDVDVEAGERKRVELELVRAETLEVAVVFGEEPVPAARFLVHVDGLERRFGVATGLDGVALVRWLQPGTTVVLAMDDHHWWCPPRVVTVDEEGERVTLEVAPCRPDGRSAEVIVVDAVTGAPLNGVRFEPGLGEPVAPGLYRFSGRAGEPSEVRREGYRHAFVVWDAVAARLPAVALEPLVTDGVAPLAGRVEPASDPFLKVAWIPERGEFVTGDVRDGRFLLSEVPIGRGLLRVDGEMLGAAMELVLPVEGQQDVRLELRPMRQVPVRAVDAADGMPLRCFELRAQKRVTEFVALVRVPVGMRLPLEIDAPGYQRATVVLDDATPRDGVTVRMQKLR